MARLLLISLLAVDWAAGPEQETSPRSTSRASTPVCCHSLAGQAEARAEVTPAPGGAALEPHPARLFPLVPTGDQAAAYAEFSRGLLLFYLYMALLR